METRVAVLAIIVREGTSVAALNELLHQYGKHIIGRMGVPYHQRGVNIISVAMDGPMDSVSALSPRHDVNVLNQWTYHARLYDAARYITGQEDMDLVQFVSFGCGLDAVTTDEVRSILREKDRIYTQIKIDEITNVGAVRIRLRSLLAALEDRK